MTNAKSKEALLVGRVAVVSGGAQGIGRAIVERLQSEGAQIVLLDCDSKAGETAARELGTLGSAHRAPMFVCTDVYHPDSIRVAMQSVAERHGHINILVNNAGVDLEKPLAEITPEDWDLVLAVNLRGAFFLTQAAVPLFPSLGGAVVNISSIHATHAFADSIPYACSKAGLLALTRNLALELAPRRIRVNAICPGYIDTRLWEEYLRRSPNPEALAAQVQALHPIGRRGVPADIAEAALFLASDGASFITGTNLVVDGGLTILASTPDHK